MSLIGPSDGDVVKVIGHAKSGETIVFTFTAFQFEIYKGLRKQTGADQDPNLNAKLLAILYKQGLVLSIQVTMKTRAELIQDWKALNPDQVIQEEKGLLDDEWEDRNGETF